MHIGPTVGITGAQPLSYAVRAISAIRCNGGSAWWVPDSLTDSGIYTDSTGTTPVSAVGDVLGLLTDRSYGASNLGPELVSIGAQSHGNTVELTVIGSGLVVGKSYRIYLPVGCYVNFGPGWTTTGPQAAVSGYTIRVADGSVLRILNSSGSTQNYTPSVREVLGNHATQATTANKPVITRVPRKLGPELVTNGDFSSGVGWTTPAGWSISSGIATFSSATAASVSQAISFVSGRSYRVQGTITARTAGTLFPHIGGVNAGGFSSVGDFSVVIVAGSGNALFELYATAGAALSVDNISVREVLEWSNAMQFDGSNDALVIPTNTGTSGTFIVAGAPSAIDWKMLIGSGAQLSTNAGVRVGINGTSTKYIGATASGAAGAAVVSSVTPSIGMPAVCSLSWNATNSNLYVNGPLQNSATSYAAASANGLAIGAAMYGAASPGDFFCGPIAFACHIPTAISDADRKAIERFAAYLSGATYVG